MEGKYHETIDLQEAIETQLERIERLCRRATVFLSYSFQDRSFAGRMRDALIKHDYSVWLDAEVLPAGSDWMQEITSAIESVIDRAVARGFVLVLLSPNSVGSQVVNWETEYALGKAAGSANVIPIMIGDPVEIRGAMTSTRLSLLATILYFDFSEGDFDTNMDRLIAQMKRHPMD